MTPLVVSICCQPHALSPLCTVQMDRGFLQRAQTVLESSARLPLEEQTILHDKPGGRGPSVIILIGFICLLL